MNLYIVDTKHYDAVYLVVGWHNPSYGEGRDRYLFPMVVDMQRPSTLAQPLEPRIGLVQVEADSVDDVPAALERRQERLNARMNRLIQETKAIGEREKSIIAAGLAGSAMAKRLAEAGLGADELRTATRDDLAGVRGAGGAQFWRKLEDWRAAA